MAIMAKSQDDQAALRRAVRKAFDGDRTEPRATFRQALAEDPGNYKAWLWLAYTAETLEEKRAALYRAMLLHPDDEKARAEYKRTLIPSHVREAAANGAFVCYSRADELFAVELAETLKAEGLPVWIDALDISYEMDWHTEVNDALAESGVMLLILSPQMVKDENTRRELAYYLHAGKVVLPLLYRECNWRSLNLAHPPVDLRDQSLNRLRLIFALLGINQNRQP